jgi:hypothetical protein
VITEIDDVVDGLVNLGCFLNNLQLLEEDNPENMGRLTI